MSKDPDVTTLPKWAQQRIQKLEEDIKYWKRKGSRGPEDTNVRLEGGLDAGLELPMDSAVEFTVNGAKITVHIREGFPDGMKRLEIYAGGPWHHLIIEPSSSNVAYVQNVDKYGRDTDGVY